MTNHVILFIDLDEWYHCRWATGSIKSRWRGVKEFFQEYYNTDKPSGEIIQPTHRILDLLRTANVKATFFILGEVAEWYPDLVREISQAGHEIACHGMHHQDITSISRQRFTGELAQARQILESLSGLPVKGFRAPNLVIAPWLHEVLIEQGFTYDSSICPGRKIQGKYNSQADAPMNPYRIHKESLLLTGDAELVEIPIPVFPFLKLPGAVSIATRVFGWAWTRITLDAALRTGTTCYYMHPYEFHQAPMLPSMKLYEKIFLRRTGEFMDKSLQKFLKRYQGRIVAAEHYVSEYFKE